VIGQPRATQRRRPIIRDDEDALTAAIIRLATTYGRYGYRRITALLRAEGWRVNLKRVYRIWRREGLKVPQKQPRRSRLWLNDGSCIRLRPERPGHVWAYDFVQDRTQDGRSFRMLTVIDEFTRQCLAIVTARKLKSDDVLHCLTELFAIHGPPEHIRSDNGSEFTAKEVRRWLGRLGVQTLFIEPGSPWENGYNESFNSKLRDELLNAEIFTTLYEAQVLIERWRRHYNSTTERPRYW
jgi:transposase InsO family protein